MTGGGNGIGRALCRRFAAEGAKAIVVADVERRGGARRSRTRSAAPRSTPTCRAKPTSRGWSRRRSQRHGAIDLFCSNAGIAVDGDEQTPDAEWARCWDVNVMAHVYAARAVLPAHARARRGLPAADGVGGRPADAIRSRRPTRSPSTPSLAFAEWLVDDLRRSRDQGVRALPAGRAHRHAAARRGRARRSFLLDSALEPEQVADEVVKGLAAERFLILPHPEVAEYFRRKAGDYDRWLRGMRRLAATV